MPTPFLLLDPSQRDPETRRPLLASRRPKAVLGSLKSSAKYFQPSRELLGAINVSLSLCMPLLLTGDPGTGKTQVAYYLAEYFGIQQSLFDLDVRSNTTAEDLLYHFDSVAYFHAAHDPARAGQRIDRAEFIRKGPLWRAMEADGPAIVLIDEIDKAPRDFPNDLLGVLDQGHFTVRELGKKIERKPDAPPPMLVITSNSERRLPEAFLRRCIFHHIEFTPELVRIAVRARQTQLAPLDDQVVDAAILRFLHLREKTLRKRPATAELFAWLTVLAASGGADAAKLSDCALSELPHLSVLIKDRDDLNAL
ncbi:MAG TPA: MoxR family ATPase [Pseudomonadota bacterium]|nr:MoxR family ATPase [Pseudomonadota bacterium]